MRSETAILILSIRAEDREWVVGQLAKQWGGPLILRQGERLLADQLPGWIAEVQSERAGLLTCQLRGGDCEIVTLHSLQEGIGIGTALIETARRFAKAHGCRRLWLITTNDNLHALGFYQKRGFRLVKVYPGMVDASRTIKPQISWVGMNGIPIHDEIELEMRLDG